MFWNNAKNVLNGSMEGHHLVKYKEPFTAYPVA